MDDSPTKLPLILAGAAALLVTVVAQIAVRASPRALTGADVASVAKSHAREVQVACWRPEVAATEARLKVELAIAPDGRVSSAIVNQTAGDARVGACLGDRAKTWRFPASDAGGRFVVPFVFSNE